MASQNNGFLQSIFYAGLTTGKIIVVENCPQLVILSFKGHNKNNATPMWDGVCRIMRCEYSVAEYRQQETRRDGRADDAGHIGPHGVHQQPVPGIGSLALDL